MRESCRDCRLLEERIAQHRGDLQRAARAALTSHRPLKQPEAGQIKGRLQRAQRSLLEHTSVSHRL